jgi:trans-L-3-hydroxyproline dehydratase
MARQKENRRQIMVFFISILNFYFLLAFKSKQSKMPNKVFWQAPDNWLQFETVDMHTGGEPLRVITGGLPEIKGETILDKQQFFEKYLDFIRKALLWEPRGHADMYGAIITPPVSANADFGTFFMHNEGYSSMCGHAIIALVKLVYESGYLVKKNQEYIIDVPAGTIQAKAEVVKGKVILTRFKNVPSFVLSTSQNVVVSGIGRVQFDLAYGGAFYAFVDAASLGLGLEAKDSNQLIEYGKKIKKTIASNVKVKHPFKEQLSFLYGTIFTGLPKIQGHHSRNVCVFANGELDRSPTGSGISARAAIHALKDDLQIGEEITIESILDTTMTVKITKKTTYGPFAAVIPEVSGTAYFTGNNNFCIDPDDPLKTGFIFR